MPVEHAGKRGLRALILCVAAGWLAGIASLLVFAWVLGGDRGDAQRLAQHALLAQKLHDYLTSEGRSNRGILFSEFMLLLEEEVRAGRQLSERQLLDFAGAPDQRREEGNVTYYQFVFSRYAPRNWATYVTIKGGMVTRFEYGAAVSPS